jgi:TRAP-type C4-dicarboxylate transport system permease small subunit
MAQLDTTAPEATERGPLFYIGAGTLLFATFVETFAVIGRHVGIPLVGALELMQASILLLSCTAMVAATLNQSHASVTLVVSRVGPTWQRLLNIFSCVLSAVFFMAIAAGSLWVLAESWHDHEASELLRIPFRPLRIISVLAAVAIAIIFLRDMFRSRRAAS